MTEPGDQGSSPRLGIRLPDLGKLARRCRDGRAAFEHVVGLARAAERSGFDAIWLDELVPESPDRVVRANEPVFEACSVLGALAVRTGSADLGALPWVGSNRPPSLLAKVVSGLDVVSGGRAVLSLGIAPASGQPAVAGSGSVDRLSEELQVCRAMLTEEAPSFEGRYFRVAGAANRPRPVRPGGVPVAVLVDDVGAGVGPGVLSAAARYADAVLVAGPVAAVADARSRLRSELAAAGRDVDAVRLVWLSDVDLDDVVRRGEAGVADAAGHLHQGRRAGADQCVVTAGGMLAHPDGDPEQRVVADAMAALVGAHTP